MEEKIVAQLIEKYSPLGIILHGSRASNYATEHSDWDFFVFTNEEIPNKRRHIDEIIEGQYLDIMVWQFPVGESDLKNYFAKYCGAARLVYATDPLVQEMFAEAQSIHSSGLQLPSEEIALEYEDVNRGIKRLSDWKDDMSGVFFLRTAGLYSQLYNDWWNIKQNQYSVSTRKGLEFIKQHDSAFHALLKIVAGNGTNNEKLAALGKLRDSIFDTGSSIA
jgi:hypothetical protein